MLINHHVKKGNAQNTTINKTISTNIDNTKEIFWLNHITYISNDKYKADLIIPICQIVFPQNAGIFIVTP